MSKGKARNGAKNEGAKNEAAIHALWLRCEASGNSAICHLCEPPQFFKTLDDLTEHGKVHRYGSRQGNE